MRSNTALARAFRRLFLRGFAALLPTLITLWLLVWLWNFLWNSVGQYLIWAIEQLWWFLGRLHLVEEMPAGQIRWLTTKGPLSNPWIQQPLGVSLAVVLIYVVGIFVGNLIGRTMVRLLERAVLRLPLVKAIYPAAKQVTDFLLADPESRSGQFQGARVVAVQARHQGVWSIGLVTGKGYRPLNEAIKGEMLTIFIPSSPASFSGYVVVASRDDVVELPLTVEEALRVLVSGGVIMPPAKAGVSEGKDLASGAGVAIREVPAGADVPRCAS